MSDKPFPQADSQPEPNVPLKDSAEPNKPARIPQGRSKTDLGFWKRRIFKPVWSRSDGTRVESANFAVEISFRGRRIKWSLDTPNREAAAARAKEIFLFLQSNGWEAALAKYRPKEAPKPKASEITVGEFLEAVEATRRLSAQTFTDYALALRRVVAQIASIPDSNRKFDQANGGHSRWIEAIDSHRLALITPEALERWRRNFLCAAKSDPISQRSARTSVNSYLRRAKSLFQSEILKQLGLTLPDPLPFSGVKYEKRGSGLKYHSDFDIRSLIAAARTELALSPAKIELFKIFLLAAMCGLRRREIDLLPWTAFHFEAGVLRIEATEFFQPKSDDSNAELPLDPELVTLFRGYFARPHGQFVIESGDPLPGVAYRRYRCGALFCELSRWLRGHGVKAVRPLHTLRKEFGSLINRTHGIHAASRALRHSSIGITAEIYVDSRIRVLSGLGYLLSEQESSKVLPLLSEPSTAAAAASGQA